MIEINQALHQSTDYIMYYYLQNIEMNRLNIWPLAALWIGAKFATFTNSFKMLNAILFQYNLPGGLFHVSASTSVNNEVDTHNWNTRNSVIKVVKRVIEPVIGPEPMDQ